MQKKQEIRPRNYAYREVSWKQKSQHVDHFPSICCERHVTNEQALEAGGGLNETDPPMVMKVVMDLHAKYLKVGVQSALHSHSFREGDEGADRTLPLALCTRPLPLGSFHLLLGLHPKCYFLPLLLWQ